jgi:hypothetical protein
MRLRALMRLASHPSQDAFRKLIVEVFNLCINAHDDDDLQEAFWSHVKSVLCQCFPVRNTFPKCF